MIERTYFEIMPFARGEEEAVALPQPARLTVSCSPKHGVDHSLGIATRLRALGHTMTLHLAARTVRDRAHLDGLLAALAQAGIHDVFLIGGDAPAPKGLYASAVDLLPLVHQHPHRPRTIGIAGYPEGHPLIDAQTLTQVLEEKSRFADYITTQLCFNPDAVIQWTTATRQAGITLPVIVGLPGLIDRRKLLEISIRVGVGPSLSFLRRQGGKLLLLSSSSVVRLHETLSPLVGDAQLGISGFHYFTFNRLLDTWRWVRARSGSNSVDTETQKEVTPR